MGLLTLGKPMSWDETKKWAEHVRQHGIKQFINIHNKFKDREDQCFKWGDEIEYMLVKFDDLNHEARLALKASEIFEVMDKREAEEGDARTCLWRPECGAYMIEGTPGKPYGASNDHTVMLSHFNQVENNMKERRREVENLLKKDEALLCLTSFPRLGCPDFSYPKYDPQPATNVSGSLFFPDEAIYTGHPRFKTLGGNIRSRRGRRVIINIPIYKDLNTPDPFIEHFKDEEAEAATKADHIYMDAMSFGMGCCCLQVTFQGSNIEEACVLYDQLTPLCPILLALSAASPIHRGYLSDLDCRWSVISQSMDDRTKEELGEEPLTTEKYRINKSRYDSIDSYISHAGAKYNDIQLVYNKEYYQEMVKAGVDPLLARHVAHLFIRDPIILFEEKISQDDEEESDHFENIQSTNWQTMRFKPPPPDSKSIGWRVEFRPMEIQFTEFENAAFAVFVALLTRVILTYRLNLLIPISKVDENMKDAQKRDAALRGKFWFRKDIITQTSPPEASACVEATGCPSSEACPSTEPSADESCILMSVDEIINGKGNSFPGLVPLLKQYLLSVEIDAETHCTVQQYLNLIANRASGNFSTTAAWIRKFVHNHPQYNKDSVINKRINYDLVKAINEITSGETLATDLVGDSPYIRDRLLKK